MKELQFSPEWNAVGTPFRHTWKGLVNVDQFRWLVRGDMQDQLRAAHRELGARHVRAVGLLDDELRVLTADPVLWKQEKKTHLDPNWQINTMIFERLLDMGIRPIITTCFMPGILAAGDRTVFETKSRISLPKDMGQWRKLVGDLTRHFIKHFGIEVVRDCYFEVWNEPNLQNGFFEGNQDDFFNLYLNTVSAIKEVDSSLKVGGPSTARAEWIPEFLEFCCGHKIEPEYIIGHIYNNDSDSKSLSPFDGLQEDQISKSPHFASGVIRGTRKFLDSVGYKGEVHWNEWGRSWFPCEPARETVNEAAYIVKTMAEVSQMGDYFAYWCLSDIYDQVGYGRQTFHGNYGLLNLQGLRKPSYHAFQLLGLLGNQRVGVGGSGLDKLNNAIATSATGHSELIVYSYDENTEPGAEERKIFVNLPPGQKSTKLYRLANDENNILKEWESLGSPCYLNYETRRKLELRNIMRASSDFSHEGSLVSFTMKTPGVAFLSFE